MDLHQTKLCGVTSLRVVSEEAKVTLENNY